MQSEALAERRASGSHGEPTMRSASLLAAAVAIGAFVTGCGSSLVPFTHEIRSQHNLQANELKNLQFYLSHKITLRRELESGSRQVTGSHKLLLTSGKTIEEVVVEEKTPGIAVAIGDHTITISFEQGSSLIFASSSTGSSLPSGGFAEPPTLDPFPGNSPERRESPPVVQPSLFTGNYWLLSEPGGQIAFQGTLFTSIEDTERPHLMIDSESLEEVVQNRKVLPGLRLPNQ